MLSAKFLPKKAPCYALRFNSQSLSAKFDDFQVVIEQLNTNNAVSVICLQETWLSSESPTSLYDLPNYQISRGINIVQIMGD